MIRPAIQKDIPDIKELMQSEPGFWQDSWRPDVLEHAIESADSLAFVWEQNEQILGFICTHDVGFRAYLSELIVAKSARSQGIGKQLVEHVQAELTKRGCAVLISDVWRDAEGFYKSLGWEEPTVKLLHKHLNHTKRHK